MSSNEYTISSQPFENSKNITFFNTNSSTTSDGETRQRLAEKRAIIEQRVMQKVAKARALKQGQHENNPGLGL